METALRDSLVLDTLGVIFVFFQLALAMANQPSPLTSWTIEQALYQQHVDGHFDVCRV